MMSFKEYVENQEHIDALLNEFNDDSLSMGKTPENTFKPEVWSAKKPEILQMWQNLRSDVPIFIKPMEKNPISGQTSSYGEDGIRITGSWNFIMSVLGRLKDLVHYENPQSRLRLIFRGVEKTPDTPLDKNSFVFYVNLEKRSRRGRGRPKNNKVKNPFMP